MECSFLNKALVTFEFLSLKIVLFSLLDVVSAKYNQKIVDYTLFDLEC